MKFSQSSGLAYAGVTMSVFFWGTNFNAGHYVISHMTVVSAMLERFLIATALLLAVFGASGKLRMSILRDNLLPMIGLGLLGITAFNLGIFFGLRSTTAINGALIMATTPLSTMVLAAFLEGERITPLRAAGLAVGLLGVVSVITRGDLAALLALKVASGDILIFAASLAWAVNTVLSRRLIKGATPLETTTFTMTFGTLGLAVLAFLLEQPVEAIGAAPIGVHAAILYLAACGSTLAYLMWFNGVQKNGSARTAVFVNLVPVFTMLVSALLGTPPNQWQLLGAAAVVAGVALSSGVSLKSAPATVNVGAR